jgi:hypothetical protein
MPRVKQHPAPPFATPRQRVRLKHFDGSTRGPETPMKRPAQPEEVAPAFVFFAANIDSSRVAI